jgi:hypothetical protein
MFYYIWSFSCVLSVLLYAVTTTLLVHRRLNFIFQIFTADAVIVWMLLYMAVSHFSEWLCECCSTIHCWLSIILVSVGWESGMDKLSSKSSCGVRLVLGTWSLYLTEKWVYNLNHIAVYLYQNMWMSLNLKNGCWVQFFRLDEADNTVCVYAHVNEPKPEPTLMPNYCFDLQDESNYVVKLLKTISVLS